MADFFTDPFGGSFIGRTYTKMAKAAAGNNSYSVFNSEKDTKAKSTNAKYIALNTVESANKFTNVKDDDKDDNKTVYNKELQDKETEKSSKSYYSEWAKKQDKETIQKNYNDLIAQKEKSNSTWNKIKTKLFEYGLPCGSLPEIWGPYNEGQLSALKEHLETLK